MLLWLLLSCDGSQDVTAPAPGPLDDSWLATVVDTPPTFEALMKDGVDPWARLHENDLGAASQSTGPSGQRARLELAILHEDLGRLGSTAWLATVEAWQLRSSLPSESALTWLAGVAALELGETEASTHWLTLASISGSPHAQQAASALLTSPSLGTNLEAPENPLAERFNLHQKLRTEGSAGVPTTPLVREHVGEYVRELFDPQLHWTVSAAYASAEPVEEGLAALIFGHCLTPSDLAENRGTQGVRCAVQTSWALGVDAEPSDSDDPDHARQVARAITEALDTWQNQRLRTANADGQALLRDLQLIDKLRAQILLGLARDALKNHHPHQAVAYIETGLDKSNPREISPVNAPAMFAVLAEARLLTGHTREALDALQVLTKAYPEAAGVDEIVSDLAILQGLDRQGDSKEN